jgi:hypothetical protein
LNVGATRNESRDVTTWLVRLLPHACIGTADPLLACRPALHR